MISKHRYLNLPPEGQKLWYVSSPQELSLKLSNVDSRHSQEFEVMSGMLFAGRPTDFSGSQEEWEKTETAAMQEVVGLYGKTWHCWQIDRGDEIPLGIHTEYPRNKTVIAMLPGPSCLGRIPYPGKSGQLR